MLLLEYVPESEREWIQFLGRTARHDHPGQYLNGALGDFVVASTMTPKGRLGFHIKYKILERSDKS